MFTRRRLLLLALTVALIVLAGTWRLWPRSAITRENAARIQPGMELAEVAAILGGPPRVEYTGTLEVVNPEKRGPAPLDRGGFVHFSSATAGYWVGDRFLIWVAVDEGGHVTDVVGLPVSPAPDGHLAMLRRQLGL